MTDDAMGLLARLDSLGDFVVGARSAANRLTLRIDYRGDAALARTRWPALVLRGGVGGGEGDLVRSAAQLRRWTCQEQQPQRPQEQLPPQRQEPPQQQQREQPQPQQEPQRQPPQGQEQEQPLEQEFPSCHKQIEPRRAERQRGESFSFKNPYR